MDFKKFSMVGQDLYSLGLVDSHGGSLSVREGDKIYITKKNAMLGHLEESDIIEVPLEGVAGGEDQASIELISHRAIYKDTSFNAVIFAKPPCAVALSNSADNKIMLQDTDGQTLLKGIPVVRGKGRPGSEEVAKMLPAIYKSGYVVSVVKDYGSFAIGNDILEALRYTTCLEFSCRIITASKRPVPVERPREMIKERRSAIPPSIGVMGRSRNFKRGLGRT